MHARRLILLASAGLLAAQLQGILTSPPAAACDSGQSCPSPVVVQANAGMGSVRVGVSVPGSSSPGGSGGSGGSNGSGGGSHAAGSAVGAPGSAASNPFFIGDVPPAAPAAAGAPPAPPPPPPAIALARAAWGQLVLPSPQPGRYPSGILRESGHPYTIVNANTWFWTAPETWQTLSKTVTVGAVWGRATATPTRLSLQPGDGHAEVSCPGPGAPWQANDTTWLAPVNPAGCSYKYSKSSLGRINDQVSARYTITWTITWAGSDGTGGTFGQMLTDTPVAFAVAEVQTVRIK